MRFLTEFSLGEVRKLTPEGFLVAESVPIARLGSMDYLPSEVTSVKAAKGKVELYREEQDLFNPETIASFEGKPIILPPKDREGHAITVDPETWGEHAIGHIQNVRRDGNFLVADLFIGDQEGIDAVNNGTRQLSCGYTADVDDEGNGRGRQANIRGNHLCLVRSARGGSELKIGDIEEGEHWITLENGQHVLIGKNGQVKAGAGGNLNGKYYSTYGTGPDSERATNLSKTAKTPEEHKAAREGHEKAMVAVAREGLHLPGKQDLYNYHKSEVERHKGFERKPNPQMPQGRYVGEGEYEVKKVGRKWLEVTQPGKTYAMQMEKSHFAVGVEPGARVKGHVYENKEVSKYGTKVTLHPLDTEQVEYAQKQSRRPELTRWLGYVKQKAEEGYLYQRGVEELKNLKISEHPDLEEQFNSALETIKGKAKAKDEAHKAMQESKENRFVAPVGKHKVGEIINGRKITGFGQAWETTETKGGLPSRGRIDSDMPSYMGSELLGWEDRTFEEFHMDRMKRGLPSMEGKATKTLVNYVYSEPHTIGDKMRFKNPLLRAFGLAMKHGDEEAAEEIEKQMEEGEEEKIDDEDQAAEDERFAKLEARVDQLSKDIEKLMGGEEKEPMTTGDHDPTEAEWQELASGAEILAPGHQVDKSKSFGDELVRAMDKAGIKLPVLPVQDAKTIFSGAVNLKKQANAKIGDSRTFKTPRINR